MKKFHFIFLIPLLFCGFNSSSKGIPKNTRRILFLGNSITYSGQYITDIEAWFIARYPNQHIEFINAGLPSETVSGLSEEGHAGGAFPRPDLHERLARVLAQTKPDLVLASYGMNDGIYQPFDEGRFQKYKEGILWLHEEVMKSGAQIIHLTPPVYDEQRGSAKGYNQVLDCYSDWLLSQRKIAKWKVADVHFPMKTYLERMRKNNSEFYFAKDGVHPDDTGHWVMAKQILLYFKQNKVAKCESIVEALKPFSKGEEILKLVTERQGFMKDAWLTSTGHKRPAMKTGLPMSEANLKADGIEKQLDILRKDKQ